MKCYRIKKRLSAYLDGELSADLREAIGHHLQKCEECQSLAARMQSVYRRMGDPIELPADAFFVTRLRAELERRQHSVQQPSWQRWLWRTIVPVTAALGLFIGVELGLQLEQHWQDSQLGRENYLDTLVLDESLQSSLTAHYLALNGWSEAQDEK